MGLTYRRITVGGVATVVSLSHGDSWFITFDLVFGVAGEALVEFLEVSASENPESYKNMVDFYNRMK